MSVESTTPSVPTSDEVRVAVSLAGLCGTDYRIWAGDRPVSYPRIMRHEFVGVVDAIGDNVPRVRPGDRVVIARFGPS